MYKTQITFIAGSLVGQDEDGTPWLKVEVSDE